jgi:hypothetical protein
MVPWIEHSFPPPPPTKNDMSTIKQEEIEKKPYATTTILKTTQRSWSRMDECYYNLFSFIYI